MAGTTRPPITPPSTADAIESASGAASPAGWWRYGLVALLIVAAILLALQFLGGNKGTDVIPGTPTAAPQTETQVQ